MKITIKFKTEREYNIFLVRIASIPSSDAKYTMERYRDELKYSAIIFFTPRLLYKTINSKYLNEITYIAKTVMMTSDVFLPEMTYYTIFKMLHVKTIKEKKNSDDMLNLLYELVDELLDTEDYENYIINYFKKHIMHLL
jgi:hypothetical protein